MADDDTGGVIVNNLGGDVDREISYREYEIRKYEADAGVRKIVWGTAVVGVASALITGVISFFSTYAEVQRKDIELQNTIQTAYLQYIKEFVNDSVRQDIEQRIRLAEYFANLAGGEQAEGWKHYLNVLTQTRDHTRAEISDLEKDLANLQLVSPDSLPAQDDIRRRLDWAYAELGYLQKDRSIVVPISQKRARLYAEAVALARKLVDRTTAIDVTSKDYIRFWELYHQELIGIESASFARAMINIGSKLRALIEAKSPPDQELKNLVEKLASTMADETVGQPTKEKNPGNK